MLERVPKERYFSAEFAAAERARLWPNHWLHAAPLDAVATPGAFVTVDLPGADVLLVRGRDGVLRAFHNVCLHRGRRLADGPCGQASTLRCAYHYWQWHLDGSLAHVSEASSFGPGLDKESLKLREIPCDTWAGQAFVHLGKPAQPLLEWLAPLPALLGRFDFGDYALTEHVSFAMPCNWKTVADAFNEAYHLHAVHPYIIGALDEANATTELHGWHAVQKVPLAKPSARLASRKVGEALGGLAKGLGVDAATLGDDGDAVQAKVREALRAKGGNLAQLEDWELVTAQTWFLFPSCTLTVYPDQLILHRYRPIGTDPERSWLDQLSWQRVMPGAARPAPPKPQLLEPGQTCGQRVLDDDVANLVQVQRGMHSPGLPFLTVGDLEQRVVHLHEKLDAVLGTDFRAEIAAKQA